MSHHRSDSDSEASESDANPLHHISPEILDQLAHLNLTGQRVLIKKKSVSIGAYGDISRCKYDIEGRGIIRVAVKCLRFYMKDDIKLLFEKEIYVWSKLKHNNILPLLGYDFDDVTGYPLLVSEWMEKGTTWSYVRTHPEANVARLILGIAQGLAYLHEEGVIHSDIKSDNILVSNSGEALICDFGCSRMLAASRTLILLTSGLKGTSSHLAYELVNEDSVGHTKQSDVWAFGMTVFELLSQKRPFEGMTDLQALAALLKYHLPHFPQVFSTKISAEEAETYKTICLSCWARKPSERPSMASVVAKLELLSRPRNVPAASDALGEGFGMPLDGPHRYHSDPQTVPTGAAVPLDIPGRQTRTRLHQVGGEANEDGDGSVCIIPAVYNEWKGKRHVEHVFQRLSSLRLVRCDLCRGKMLGSQFRCSTCTMSVHVRCVLHVQVSCYDGSAGGSDKCPVPAGTPSSMFGRDLIEQVRKDAKTSKNSNLFVPIIVEKCINFVETNAMDYGGIYRVTGGLEQSKAIITLFERRDYEFSYLSDLGLFAVPSITFVLENYFEMLPNPLLTFKMHDAFIAAGTGNPHSKGPVMRDLVRKLPIEHYRTLSQLMLHLHRIQLNAKVNLMNAQDLGVIFGPILMRSVYPSQQLEIANIGGSVLVIEFLIENAPLIFPTFSSSSVSRSTS